MNDMKTSVIVLLVVLFLLSVSYFFTCKDKCKKDDLCKPKVKDKRAESIKRARKNLHPIINRNVDRDKSGRFCKRS